MRKVWVADFGNERVTALTAREKPNGDWEVLGGGEARSRGILSGDIECLGDAVESVVEAVRKTERSSGHSCTRLFYNFDDKEMESHHPSGAKSLAGDGQIAAQDVREAAQSALRDVAHFERVPIYAKETGYVIDGKDAVGNAVGAFGHKLDVVLHVLTARAGHVASWRRLMERAGFENAVPVPSLLSSKQGVFSAQNRSATCILWDAGSDLTCGSVVEKGVLCEYAVWESAPHSPEECVKKIAAVCREWEKKRAFSTPVYLTGDRADEMLAKAVSEFFGKPAEILSPWGFSKLAQPRYASLAGLVRIAAEWQYVPGSRRGQNFITGIRQKAVSLLNEYF